MIVKVALLAGLILFFIVISYLNSHEKVELSDKCKEKLEDLSCHSCANRGSCTRGDKNDK